jgi:hypothetical protein
MTRVACAPTFLAFLAVRAAHGESGGPGICSREPLGRALRAVTYTEKEEPQPQVLFTPGLLNLKPEPCSPST